MININAAEKAIKDLLVALGEDPNRDGLIETPKRVAKMYTELLSGNDTTPQEVLKYFDEDFCEEMVVVKDITFHSMCEHHMMPFFGVAHICYVPSKSKLLGLSKLARIVEMYARRLQLQEKMGGQIAEFLMNEAQALGVAVVIEAEHMCMSMRGIKKIGAVTVTTALRGKLKENEKMRAEALDLLRR